MKNNFSNPRVIALVQEVTQILLATTSLLQFDSRVVAVEVYELGPHFLQLATLPFNRVICTLFVVQFHDRVHLLDTAQLAKLVLLDFLVYFNPEYGAHILG